METRGHGQAVRKAQLQEVRVRRSHAPQHVQRARRDLPGAQGNDYSWACFLVIGVLPCWWAEAASQPAKLPEDKGPLTLTGRTNEEQQLAILPCFVHATAKHALHSITHPHQTHRD